MPVALLAGLCVDAAPRPAAACIWDRDTLLMESKRAPGVIEAITGRFERYPPEYYEHRIARLEHKWASAPDSLTFEEFDDAGAACDRVGRGDEAIAWMERKHARIEAQGLKKSSTHVYRYHANLGTFLAHAWLRGGADRSDITKLRDGRAHIAIAMHIRPNAHFGRERYQLLAMDWLLDPPEPLYEDLPLILEAGRSNAERRATPDVFDAEAYEDVLEGLTGLVVLGAAWESVDIFHALKAALQEWGHAHLAKVAGYRLDELTEAGRRSLHPSAAQDLEQHRAQLDRSSFLVPPSLEVKEEHYARYYKAARREAELWNEERFAYIRAGIADGRHPDTDPAFWDDFKATTWPPRFPGQRGDRASWRRVLEPRVKAWYEDLPSGVQFLIVLALGGGVVLVLRRYT